MKRNVWEITYIVWAVVVICLMLFWPARAAEDTERTENRTEHHFRKVTKMVCPLGERERKGGRGDGEGEGACGDDG